MGLGIGIYCECCGNQLYLDADAAEAAKYTIIEEDGRQIIRNRPVLCHTCTMAKKFFSEERNGSND